MKIVYGIKFLVILILSAHYADAQEDNNSVLDKKISLEAHQETIAAVLEQISTLAKVYFSYDASLIDSDKKTDLLLEEKTVREALDSLLNSRYIYDVIGDQIVIAIPEPNGLNINYTYAAGDKQQTIILRGKIIDAHERTALPYSSISVFGKNMGTISNNDGNFELKISDYTNLDTIIISCLGYKPYRKSITEAYCNNCTISLQPTSILLKEIKVTVINAASIAEKVIEKIPLNYPAEPEIMTAFYREVLKQDDQYIDVSEALLEIIKASYENSFADDKIKFVRGRKNLNVKPFSIVDFKIQGGPYYATKLDVIKTLDSFLNPEIQGSYKYMLDEIIEVNNRETYVIQFKPSEKLEDLSYQGKIYVDMSTLALVQADFSLSRTGLKVAHQLMIKKKPKDFYVRPVNADYSVSYRKVDNKWHLNNAQTSVKFKVRNKTDRINSNFHSTSELLITDFKPGAGEHYKRNELFGSKDIFSEMITSYDENFWKDYNIIRPTEELLNTLKSYYQKNDTLFRNNEKANFIMEK
jgi:hypothetical protein